MKVLDKNNKVLPAIEDELLAIERQVSILEARKKEIMSEIKEQLIRGNLKSVVTDMATYTYVAPTTKSSFNTKGLQAMYPAIYAQFAGVTAVSESIKVKWKVATDSKAMAADFAPGEVVIS